MNAELFGEHATTYNRDTFRGIIAGISAEFRDLVKWIITAKQANDVVLIGDGRSEIARAQIRDVLREAVGDGFY